MVDPRSGALTGRGLRDWTEAPPTPRRGRGNGASAPALRRIVAGSITHWLSASSDANHGPEIINAPSHNAFGSLPSGGSGRERAEASAVTSVATELDQHRVGAAVGPAAGSPAGRGRRREKG
jgi:hypothetical protein